MCIRKTLLLLSISLLVVFKLSAKEKPVVWFNGKSPVTYAIANPTAPVVKTALDMFSGDLQQVTGFVPQQKPEQSATIRIIQYSADAAASLRALGIPADSLSIRQDAFYIKVVKNQIIVAGSDARGTAYGILELSRLAGVSPWVWWADSKPKKQATLTLAANYTTFQYPSVAYRGIFINDEDWSLQPWSWKHFDPQGKDGLISGKTYKEVFKLLMRLRANAIWPGMHGVTVPFYFTPGAKEAADECGIVIGTSHCEPLMRNNVGEWDEQKRGHFNFIDNHDAVIDYWSERLKEVQGLENYYTVGMRGVHDGEMEGVHTLQEKTDALQKVIYEQRELLAKYINKDVTKIPQQFVPYKEVLAIYENGLTVPDDITLTWCDDNYGYMTRLSDSIQQQRSGGAGVYYHLSYWGRPHDYLWLTTTQPGLIYNEMREAYNHNARRLWIVNVHDLKPAAYDLEFFLDLAWNFKAIQPSSINNHQENWLKREFGNKAGVLLAPAMHDFYRLCGIRKPEFMGWSRVEEDKKKYERGWTPVINSEFSLTEFGGELDSYLYDYDAIKKQVDVAEKNIPPAQADAFYILIKYPVYAAAAMATKSLEAQRARILAAATPEAEWGTNKALITACAKSKAAYAEILKLTEYYNTKLSGGKWNQSMSYKPRDLHVFSAPELPKLPDNVNTNATDTAVKNPGNNKSEGFIAQNAAAYVSAKGKAEAIQSLGHSMQAVALAKGASVTFEFTSEDAGEAVLRTAVIPTQPNDKGDIRFSVQIDNQAPQICSFKEPFRSEQWKENVLRGQAIRQTKHNITKGKHTLTITALDNHVVLDQWMLDFKPERKFYMFPVKGE